jgi:paraquat-inducible protein B
MNHPSDKSITEESTYPNELPEVAVRKRRGPSLVWLIPLVAALIGAWLAYKTLSEQGPVVAITFKEGTGLEAGKTKVMYKALQVGTVETVRLSEDLSHVLVTASLGKDVEPHLGENTKFWVVRPRIGISGVSGLETLFSGAYIEVEFGSGEPTRKFQGLSQPPEVKADTPGRQFILLSDRLGSLQHNSPIYFRDIQVGEVLTYELAEDEQSVQIHIFINAPYHLMVKDNTRFWKTSGLDISLGAQGIDVKTESLLSFLAGGITFETPRTEGKPEPPSPDGSKFRLYKSFDSIAEESYTYKIPYVMYFDSSVRGLNIGAPVEFRGIKVGAVTDIKLEVDRNTMEVRIPVIAEFEPERIVPTDPGDNSDPRHGIEKLIERGLSAQLKTGNLLTGQLFVDLDFYPNNAPKQMTYHGQYPELPTVPTTLEAFQKTATDLVEELKKLPLDQLVNELLGTIQGTNQLVNAPELRDSLRSLKATAQQLETLTGKANQQFVSLISSTEKTLQTARTALQIAAPGSPLMINLTHALQQLAAAAGSIRALSDYLQRHPESLLYGKGRP